MRLAPRTAASIRSPIGDAYALLGERRGDRELLDLSQAAPAYPPPPSVTDALIGAARDPAGARYAPQPGIAPLREALAEDLTVAYGAAITPDEVLVTAGCNQAFCVAIGALAEPGDDVVLAEPFYFNHDMWLRLQGIGVQHLRVRDDRLPAVEDAAAMIGPRTRAIILVSPGNPTGVTIPPERLHAFGALAAERGIALVLDETYRNFRGTSAPAHEMFDDSDWGDHLVSLHSLSKDLAIPGYRIGALVAARPVVGEALKLLDCVAISAPGPAQVAAAAGLRDASGWREEQQQRLLGLQAHFESVMADRPGGFELVSAGGFFGWVRHPHDLSTAEVVRRLLLEHDVLTIPGTAFTAVDEAMVRFSFANLTPELVEELPHRLDEWS
ncbi:MAG: aminotransferase [Actinomycetota bacterium]